jgi:hypothetical protein
MSSNNLAIIWQLLGVFGDYLVKRKCIEKVIKLNPVLVIWNLYDFLLFFLILPGILVLIYSLPPDMKESFTLIVSNPTILTMFLSHYTHLEYKHFLSNIITYFLIIFLIFNVETNKKIFYVSSFLIFIILPFVSSLSNIIFTPNIPKISGFSAIVSGLIGYFIFAVYNYLKKVSTLSVKAEFFSFLILVNLSIVGIINLGTPIHIKVLLAVISIVFLLINLKTMQKISIHYLKKLKELVNHPPILSYRVGVFVIAIVYLFSLPNLIPSEIRRGTNLINILAHYVGFCFGVIVPSVMEKIPQLYQICEKLSRRLLR